jgi:assimilatory nitrate reductase catalytic subunit
MFADGRFYTPGGRGRFVAVTAPPAIDVREAWPFVLNTGRIRDQWHTMTRTGLSPRLLTHIGEPYVEVHPQDAARLGLEQGTIARVRTCHGEALLRVLVSRNQQTGSLFAPIHWSDENSAGGGIGRLVHGDCDPVSGQPDSKATPASIEPAGLTHFGFLLSRARPAVAGLPYWTLAPMAAGHVLYFAMSSGGGEWDPRTTAMLPSGERLTLVDDALGIHRAAVLREGRLEAVLYCGIGPKLPSPDWLKSCFALDPMSAADRRALLAGRPAASQDDEGAIVCVCFQVGALRIEAAIRDGALTSEAVGAACGAGTNCGSCIPELRRMLRSREPAHA